MSNPESDRIKSLYRLIFIQAVKLASIFLSIGLFCFVLLGVFLPPSLPPGAVYETNDAQEWRVVLDDKTIVPSHSIGGVTNKKEVAEWAWVFYKDKHSPTNKSNWRVVR